MEVYKHLVKKPWGEEYCVFRNDQVSIWLLKILPNQKTSLHCHPNKKTGLILLDGKAQVNLIERSFTIEGFAKIMLRNGMFHQTHNNSNQPIYVLEVETPDNKFDLIRIQDDYGRENSGFEGSKSWQRQVPDFKISSDKKSVFNNFTFEIVSLEQIFSKDVDPNDKIMIVDGCGFIQNNDQKLCEVGEVLTIKILKYLKQFFNLNTQSKAILICKNLK